MGFDAQSEGRRSALAVSPFERRMAAALDRDFDALAPQVAALDRSLDALAPQGTAPVEREPGADVREGHLAMFRRPPTARVALGDEATGLSPDRGRDGIGDRTQQPRTPESVRGTGQAAVGPRTPASVRRTDQVATGPSGIAGRVATMARGLFRWLGRELLGPLIEALLPADCPGCRDPLPGISRAGLCEACWEAIE